MKCSVGGVLNAIPTNITLRSHLSLSASCTNPSDSNNYRLSHHNLVSPCVKGAIRKVLASSYTKKSHGQQH